MRWTPAAELVCLSARMGATVFSAGSDSVLVASAAGTSAHGDRTRRHFVGGGFVAGARRLTAPGLGARRICIESTSITWTSHPWASFIADISDRK